MARHHTVFFLNKLNKFFQLTENNNMVIIEKDTDTSKEIYDLIVEFRLYLVFTNVYLKQVVKNLSEISIFLHLFLCDSLNFSVTISEQYLQQYSAPPMLTFSSIFFILNRKKSHQLLKVRCRLKIIIILWNGLFSDVRKW